MKSSALPKAVSVRPHAAQPRYCAHRLERLSIGPVKPLCVYCLAHEGTTADHVPPRVFFPEPRPQLLTVPSCPQCNNAFSKEDEEFASFLSLRVGIDSSVTEKLHQKNKRILGHNQRLKREIRSRIRPAWIEVGGIIVGRKPVIDWPGEAHDRMIRRIVRGLYFHVMKRPLPAETPIHGSWSLEFPPELLELWNEFNGENVGNEGQFRYRCAYASDKPELSCWMFTFYDKHFATGHTGNWDDVVTLGDSE